MVYLAIPPNTVQQNKCIITKLKISVLAIVLEVDVISSSYIERRNPGNPGIQDGDFPETPVFPED